jgi:hypothetical protein
MPRVAGLNIVAVLAATVAFYAVGMVIYGFTLSQLWGEEMLRNHGLLAPGATAPTGEALMAEFEKVPGAMDPAMAYGVGFVITLVTTIGIALVLKMAKPASIGAALGTGFILWLCFAATGLSYNVVYSMESQVIFGIDLMHTFIAFMLATAVLFLIDGKAMSGTGSAGAGKPG